MEEELERIVSERGILHHEDHCVDCKIGGLGDWEYFPGVDTTFDTLVTNVRFSRFVPVDTI